MHNLEDIKKNDKNFPYSIHNDRNYIGKNIRVLRDFFGITQEELAEKVNFSRSTIAGSETDNKVSLNLIIVLADYFDVPVDVLLGRRKYISNKKDDE